MVFWSSGFWFQVLWTSDFLFHIPWRLFLKFFLHLISRSFDLLGFSQWFSDVVIFKSSGLLVFNNASILFYWVSDHLVFYFISFFWSSVFRTSGLVLFRSFDFLVGLSSDFYFNGILDKRSCGILVL